MIEQHRFPHTIMRRRFTAALNQYSEPVTTHEDVLLRASVQPVLFDPVSVPEGVRVSDRLRVYTLPGVLRGADPDTQTPSDGVVVDGIEYNLEDLVTWRDSHAMANIVRRRMT